MKPEIDEAAAVIWDLAEGTANAILLDRTRHSSDANLARAAIAWRARAEAAEQRSAEQAHLITEGIKAVSEQSEEIARLKAENVALLADVEWHRTGRDECRRERDALKADQTDWRKGVGLTRNTVTYCRRLEAKKLEGSRQ